MPNLDRVWTLYPRSFRSPGEPVWIGIQSRSLLAARARDRAAEASLSGLRPVETVAYRMRWRPDVTLGSLFVDTDNRVWYVNETLEVGRQLWLDVGCSRYGAREVAARIPEDRADPTFRAPAGWRLVNGSDVPVNVVRVGDSREDELTGEKLGYQRFALLAEPGDVGGIDSGAYAASLRTSGGGIIPGHLVCDTSYTDGRNYLFSPSMPAPYTAAPVPGARFGDAPSGQGGSNDVQSGDFIVIDSAPSS